MDKREIDRRRAVGDFTSFRPLVSGVAVLFVLEVLLLWPGGAFALEADYAEPWCERMGGRSGVVLADLTRVVCLLAEHAVEVDKASNWAEAMGHALHYARMTEKLPGILLILEKPGDERYVRRLYDDAVVYGIPLFVWIIYADVGGGQ